MADTNATIPASFKEAKEAARQNMMKAARTLAENEAKPAPQLSTEDDEDPTDESLVPAASSEQDESEDVENPTEDVDDDEDEEDDESEDSDGDDDEDDDVTDEDKESKTPDPKRKPTRRSKKIQKLQSENERLRTESASVEERILERLRTEQARTAALEAEKRQREAEDRQIESEMDEYLGSDTEYQTAVTAMMNGDVFEAEKARLWHERRQIVGKLNRRAETRVNQRAAEIYWASTGDLPGVDKQILEKSDFGAVLKHLHAAGYTVAASEAKKEIEKRDAKIARLEAELKQKRVKRAATSTTTPIEGGSPVARRPEKSIYEQSMDPVTRKIDRNKFAEFQRRAAAAAHV